MAASLAQPAPNVHRSGVSPRLGRSSPKKPGNQRIGDMRTNGVNHLALVCRDMAETQDFYTRILGMPLVKTIALPDGGQHFFFDCGGGNLLAFFWWENAPPAAPGVASVEDFPRKPMSAVGSMNHVAFTVDEDELAPAIKRLEEAGVRVLPQVVNHDDSPMGVARENGPGV